jgi:hypothetical protein
MASAQPPSQLAALPEGAALLLRRPLLALGLVAMAMVLGQLGPALELAARSGGGQASQALFSFVALLPLEIYALPRWSASLDAELAQDPANPKEEWTLRFEARWLKAFGAKLLVLPFCLPIFAMFGWAPLRVLLRGDSLMEALRWSGRAMLRFWPRVVQAALAIFIVLLLGAMAILAATTAWIPAAAQTDLTALTRLRHPAFWMASACSGLFSLWATAAVLCLYHRLERLVQSSESR